MKHSSTTNAIQILTRLPAYYSSAKNLDRASRPVQRGFCLTTHATPGPQLTISSANTANQASIPPPPHIHASPSPDIVTSVPARHQKRQRVRSKLAPPRRILARCNVRRRGFKATRRSPTRPTPSKLRNLFFPSLPTLWVRNDRGGGGVVLIGVDGVCLVKARTCWLVDRGRSWRGEHFQTRTEMATGWDEEGH